MEIVLEPTRSTWKWYFKLNGTLLRYSLNTKQMALPPSPTRYEFLVALWALSDFNLSIAFGLVGIRMDMME